MRNSRNWALVLCFVVFCGGIGRAESKAYYDFGTDSANTANPGLEDTEPLEYVPNEIIVKFRRKAADVIEMRQAEGDSASELEISASLDKLNKRYKLKKARPLFKNFKENRQRVKALLKKDKALLTKKERRILRRLKRAPKGANVPELDRIYTIEVDLEAGQSLEEVVAAYNSDPDVEYAELNYRVSICQTPNDPLYPIQWSLNNTGQIYPESGRYNSPPGTPDCDIDGPEAWDIHTGNPEIVVAVIDTGVDYTHRDIDDNMWVNTGEIGGNDIDDDGNGYVDDIYGWDFRNGDSDPKDDHGHGTHCGGIIAAEGNNGLDTAGVCWDAKIMALKFLNSSGDGDTMDAVEAFYYAVENGADITSNSWGGGGFLQSAQEAIDYAYSQGVIMVVSAGNDNSSSAHYPAYYNHMISVAATNSNDAKASFSNYGDWVDIAAPGIDILSLRASGTSIGTTYDDFTTVASGTSMACPHVSAACALVLSRYPLLTVEEVYDILLFETDPIQDGICHSDGRLNIQKAIKTVNFDRSYYTCSDDPNISLVDFDLAGEPNVIVTLETDEGDYETVLLESTTRAWLFNGAIITEVNSPIIEDGILQISHGQSVTVTYQDINDGTGNPATEVDSAFFDCQGPIITNVQTEMVTCMSAIITFETNEPSTTKIKCSLDCNDTYSVVGENPEFRMNHTVYLEYLASETDYYFIIEADDIVGNQTIDDNDGLCYQFSTTDTGAEVHVPYDYPTIQEAIDAVVDCTTIVVEDGIYTGAGNRDIDFDGKAITVRSENGPASCIIDCEAQSRGLYFHSGENRYSVLEGFTIKNGYTTGRGGGVYCSGSSPTIINCIITNNQSGDKYVYWSGGGGIYCRSSNAKFINCVVSNNYTRNRGGGIWCYDGGTVQILNCVFTGNEADYVSSMGTWSYGGGISCHRANAKLKNCLIVNNWAHDFSGGINFNRSTSTVSNCTIVNNQADERTGGIYQYLSTVTIENSIIRGNTDPSSEQLRGAFTVSYSDIEGGYTGRGNIDADPLFVTGPLGDYYLSQTNAGQASTSSCVDAGNNAAAFLEMGYSTTRTDHVTEESVIDMGYHYLNLGHNNPDINADWHVNYIDYAVLASQWLDVPGILSADIAPYGGDGIVDTNDLGVLVDFWLECSVSAATDPSPGDNESSVYLFDVLLSWSAGGGAVNHDVYFGTDFDGVNNADIFSDQFKGNYDVNTYDPCSLDFGTTYYWRIDEKNICSTVKGDIWSFRTMAISEFRASNPEPADGAEDVNPNIALRWAAGYGALSHDVYFGTDYNDVNDADTLSDQFKGNFDVTSYNPGGLDLGTTYYWRIDEINTLLGTVKGDIWSFRIMAVGIDPALMGWWKFDDGSGTTAYDSSGYGNSGTIVGPDLYWVPGKVGEYALDFVIGYVSIPYDLRLDIDGAGGITVSVWIKLGWYPNDKVPIFGLYNSQGPDTKNHLGISAPTGNTIFWDQYPPSGGSLVSIKPDLDVWYHVAAVQDSTYRAIYINGDLSSSDNSPESYSGATPNSIKIGGKIYMSNFSFYGTVDDVRIYNRDLSAEEIFELYWQGQGENVFNPEPADGARGIVTNVVLSWTPETESVLSYDVYLGTDFNSVDNATPDSNEFMGNFDVNSCDPCGLDSGTTYYWRIDEKNIIRTIKSDIWSFTTVAADIDPALMGWWEFEEGAGIVTYDSSGNGNTGTLRGEPSWVSGKAGDYALDFDGLAGDGFIDSVHLSPITALEGSIVTVAGWIYANDFETYNTVLAQYNGSYDGYSLYTFNNQPSFYIGGGSYLEAVSPESINTGHWYHLAGTNDGISLKIYVDGLLKAEVSSVGCSGVTYDAYIGCDSSYAFFNGIIDDVRVYNRALSGGEIWALYQAGL